MPGTNPSSLEPLVTDDVTMLASSSARAEPLIAIFTYESGAEKLSISLNAPHPLPQMSVIAICFAGSLAAVLVALVDEGSMYDGLSTNLIPSASTNRCVMCHD